LVWGPTGQLGIELLSIGMFFLSSITASKSGSVAKEHKGSKHVAMIIDIKIEKMAFAVLFISIPICD
jgi:hypothetical protein